MALHVCRDFLTWGNPLNQWGPYYANYLLSIFMRGVLGYVIGGQTNWNIDAAPYRLGSGLAGSLNQGPNDIYAFNPNGYAVSNLDIGRILALKSPNNPMVNSGLFRITGINTTNNWLYINYRSGDTPPAETGMSWVVYENEFTFAGNVTNGGNGIVNTYQTQNVGASISNASRIVLQSPSILNWQVRLCVESNYDQPFGGGSTTPSSNGGSVTLAPGFGGTTFGDFPPGGQHLHAPLFFNTHVQYQYAGGSVGFYPKDSNQIRLYIWGDDVTGTVFVASRQVVGSGTDTFAHFGLCTNEEMPLPPHNAQRLFAFGANGIVNGSANGIYWDARAGVNRNGMSFGLSNQPIGATYSLYNPLFGGVFGSPNPNSSIRGASTAADNQYIAATELVPVDIIVGTQDFLDNYAGSNEVFILEGRRLGTAPFVQCGRANYGNWQISTDSQNLWLHTEDGIFLPWLGSILP